MTEVKMFILGILCEKESSCTVVLPPTCALVWGFFTNDSHGTKIDDFHSDKPHLAAFQG